MITEMQCVCLQDILLAVRVREYLQLKGTEEAFSDSIERTMFLV